MGLQTAREGEREKITQFSVYVENKAGRLLDLVRILTGGGVDIVGFTILDSIDAAVIRLVVDDPTNARSLLQEHTIAFNESTLVAVELPQSAEDLRKLLATLLQAEINIYFSYPLMTRPYGKAVLALRVEDDELATSVLIRNQFRVLSQKDISR
ncbi:Acetolactate synthase [Methylacidimicrobium sp. AP8]|uniref:acetolactate synthase n=1 Tax=Methylacidimicrobium sp. AP8 TaxID=2730359 RepID=UPI0018C069E1|nr:acetolactate synthase [Methylacidimicrobium sp. AP8]CAB4243877.1 Acetolactate synthase [Methylacidimicrobium sp. AP8]